MKRTWGSGSIRQRGQRWQIQWRESGRRHTDSFASKDTAERVLSIRVNNRDLGRCGLPLDYSGAPMMNEIAQPWLDQRVTRIANDDHSRWKNHIGPFFSGKRSHEITPDSIRAFIENRLSAGLRPGTVYQCISLLSVFFGHAVKQGYSPSNPVSQLPRETRNLYHSDYDTRSTPFLQSLGDVERVYRSLSEPVSVAFAIGAYAGLRTGEILGLFWDDIDLRDQIIHVYQQVQDGNACTPKGRTRLIPLCDALLPILGDWRVTTGGTGQLFPPLRPDLGIFMRPQTLAKHLRKALVACGLPPMTWYQCTRHTYATLWAKDGRSLAVLKKTLGHTSFTDTERYVHVEPDLSAAL